MKTVLVLCGGRSAEREVSCVSASAVLKNIPSGWKAELVWIDPGGRWHLQSSPKGLAAAKAPAKHVFEKRPAALVPGTPSRLLAGTRALTPDAVFPVLHGPFGEDGTMQGLLDILGWPYVGSGVLGSSVGMDKEVSKRLAVHAGLPVLPYAVLSSPKDLSAARRLRLPVFVKPARLGSSVGVYKVKKAGDLAGAVRKAFRFDTTVIVEQGIPAREVELAVLGETASAKASVAGEIRPNAEFYSYEAKYLDPNGAELLVPAKITKGQEAVARRLALEAFRSHGLHGLARVDFLMDKGTGKLWFNEVNTLPGFTAVSMYPKLWGASGLPFPRLLAKLLDLAVSRAKAQARLRITRD
jgi:D-alanine-D-alanine ligase